MNLLQVIEFLRRNLKAVVYCCYGVLALTVVADILRLLDAPGHRFSGATGFWASLHHLSENVPGFWPVFGFLGCLLLVIVSKAIIGPFVSKKEDFCDE
jgi:hypothetical protein